MNNERVEASSSNLAEAEDCLGGTSPSHAVVLGGLVNPTSDSLTWADVGLRSPVIDPFVWVKTIEGGNFVGDTTGEGPREESLTRV